MSINYRENFIMNKKRCFAVAALFATNCAFSTDLPASCVKEKASEAIATLSVFDGSVIAVSTPGPFVSAQGHGLYRLIVKRNKSEDLLLQWIFTNNNDEAEVYYTIPVNKTGSLLGIVSMAKGIDGYFQKFQVELSKKKGVDALIIRDMQDLSQKGNVDLHITVKGVCQIDLAYSASQDVIAKTE